MKVLLYITLLLARDRVRTGRVRESAREREREGARDRERTSTNTESLLYKKTLKIHV